MPQEVTDEQAADAVAEILREGGKLGNRSGVMLDDIQQHRDFIIRRLNELGVNGVTVYAAATFGMPDMAMGEDPAVILGLEEPSTSSGSSSSGSSTDSSSSSGSSSDTTSSGGNSSSDDGTTQEPAPRNSGGLVSDSSGSQSPDSGSSTSDSSSDSPSPSNSGPLTGVDTMTLAVGAGVLILALGVMR